MLLTVFITLPVSAASVKRSFSSLRRVNTWMCCRMSEDRLSDLAVIQAHTKKKKKHIKIHTVIDRLPEEKKIEN